MKRSLLLLAAMLFLSAPAFALAPTLEELPTAKAIIEKSDKEILVRARAEAEAQKDPKMDLINAYASPNTDFYQWEPVAEILRGDKEKLKYRKEAARALREKFDNIELDGRVREVKKKISLFIVKLLMDSDPAIRGYAYSVIAHYYQGGGRNIRYDPNESNYMKRNKAYRDWVKYIQK